MAEYGINDNAFEHLYSVSIDSVQDLIGNSFTVHRRLQPVVNILAQDDQLKHTGATYVRHANITHRLSPYANAIRWQWYLINNANANAAMSIKFTHSSGYSGAIYLPSADGVTIAWGGAAWSCDTYDLSLADLRAMTPESYETINIYIALKEDCEIESLYGYEVRV